MATAAEMATATAMTTRRDRNGDGDETAMATAARPRPRRRAHGTARHGPAPRGNGMGELMAFVVEVEHAFSAAQGLASRVRAGRGLSPIPPGASIPMILRVGVAFDEDQLTDRGWFFDTDATAEVVEACCDHLAERAWTELFDFRPTFELVAKHVFHRLSESIVQLAYVELRDPTFGVTTRYTPSE
jgi:6-pyruvoyltetrahydropterin/6-carboxytetrahydropterin synthase